MQNKKPETTAKNPHLKQPTGHLLVIQKPPCGKLEINSCLFLYIQNMSQGRTSENIATFKSIHFQNISITAAK